MFKRICFTYYGLLCWEACTETVFRSLPSDVSYLYRYKLYVGIYCFMLVLLVNDNGEPVTLICAYLKMLLSNYILYFILLFDSQQISKCNLSTSIITSWCFLMKDLVFLVVYTVADSYINMWELLLHCWLDLLYHMRINYLLTNQNLLTSICV